MCTRKSSPFALLLVLAFSAGTAVAETPGLGKPINEADIAAWNIEVLPDGTGLPPGSGTATQGAAIYSQKCAMCHGPQVQMKNIRLDSPEGLKAHAQQVYQQAVIARTMPLNNATHITDEERAMIGRWVQAGAKVD